MGVQFSPALRANAAKQTGTPHRALDCFWNGCYCCALGSGGGYISTGNPLGERPATKKGDKNSA